MNTTTSQEPIINDISTTTARLPTWTRWTWLILLVAIAVTYYNSFNGIFLLDDASTIVRKTSPVHKLLPLSETWPLLFVQQRPLVNLSLAINYQINGLNPWGYHLVNLVIHMLAAMVLLGLIQRTLQTRRFQSYISPQHAVLLALVVAGIWALHPLQAQSVTYVIQRSESIMGLFYLLVLYCGLRSVQSPQRRWWWTAAIVSSCLGMCSKQVMITAPLMMLMFDRVFLSDSFKQAIKRSWPMYLGLLGSMGILAWMAICIPAGTSAGFNTTDCTWWEYLRTQPGVIVHYIYVCLLPIRLCIDLAWPKANSIVSIAVPAVVVLGLLGLTIWALFRKPAIGFAGVWFFLILVPTSSFMPIRDAAFEHRLYLSLAGIVAIVVIGGYAIATNLAEKYHWSPAKLLESLIMAALAVMVVLALATVSRNSLYCDSIKMWKDVLKNNDKNPRAYTLIASALIDQGKIDQAIAEYEKALDCDPDCAEARGGLGSIYVRQGQWEKSLDYNLRAVERHPTWADQMCDLGIAYLKLGRVDDAKNWFKKALQAEPGHPQANLYMGNMMMDSGQSGPAIVYYMKSLESQPLYAEAMWRLAMAYQSRNDMPAAIAMLYKFNKINPTPQSYLELGIMLRYVGKMEEAIESLREAQRLAPASARAQAVTMFELGLTYEAKGDVPLAVDMFNKANAVLPAFRCYMELGMLLGENGRLDETIQAFRGALQLEPSSAVAQLNLGRALEAKGLLRDARGQYEAAIANTKDEQMKVQLQSRLRNITAALASRPASAAD